MTSPATRRFVRHYVEMVLVMMGGMVVLGLPAEGALRAVGSSSAAVADGAPALVLAAMGASMTAPMVGWMRLRGHGWRPTLEMAASMVVPTVGAIALLPAGVAFDVLLAAEHVVMLPAMLVAMLLRRDEYSGHHHEHRARGRAHA